MDQNNGGEYDLGAFSPAFLRTIGVDFSEELTSGPNQNLAGPMLDHANLQFNSALSQYPASSQGPSQYHANRLVNPGPSQYHAIPQVNPGPSQHHGNQQFNPGSTQGTDVSPGALSMQTSKQRTKSAIYSEKQRKKKQEEFNEMKMELNDLKEENERLKAGYNQLKEQNDYLNDLQQNTQRLENEAKAALKKKCDDLENTVQLLEPMVINTENLQTEYETLKIRVAFLEKTKGKDANEIIMKKYSKLKLKNKLLKTANRSLSFQIMKYNDDKQNRDQGEASNTKRVHGHGLATNIQN